MNLNMIRTKNETEDLILSITKNCETLIKQTHTRLEETMEFKMIKPRETFCFTPTIPIKGDWMIGLMDLELYTSIFNITEENNKFELYTDSFNEFSFEELIDELEKIFNISKSTSEHLQGYIITPRVFQAYRKLGLEKSSTDGYFILLVGYARSPFRGFEVYLRIVVGSDEDDIHLILKQYNEKLITHKLTPGIYTIKDIAEVVYTMGGHEGTLQIE